MRIAIDINDVLRDYTTQFKNYYIKGIDDTFEIDDKDIKSFDLFEVFPFKDRNEYNKFRYVDYAFEIYGRAESMDKMLPYRLSDWVQRTLRDLDEENVPEVLVVCPFEAGLAIQSTYSFLAKTMTRIREVHFPTDSSKIWDKCDILITANPNLIENAPEGKTVIKIETPYNIPAEAKYSFKSMMDVINDPEETVIKILTGEINE